MKTEINLGRHSEPDVDFVYDEGAITVRMGGYVDELDRYIHLESSLSGEELTNLKRWIELVLADLDGGP
jgi:hypothetical protein